MENESNEKPGPILRNMDSLIAISLVYAQISQGSFAVQVGASILGGLVVRGVAKRIAELMFHHEMKDFLEKDHSEKEVNDKMSMRPSLTMVGTALVTSFALAKGVDYGISMLEDFLDSSKTYSLTAECEKNNGPIFEDKETGKAYCLAR